MIRFIAEKEADKEAQSAVVPDNQVQKIELKTVKHSNPEQIQASSVALKSLKRKNDLVDLLKRRLSFLQVQEEKNAYRAISNEKKYEAHCSVREQMSREREEKERRLRLAQQKLRSSKEQLSRQRQEREEALLEAKNRIRSSNAKDYEQITEKSEEISKMIHLTKEQDITSKKVKKCEIAMEEERQRESVARFFDRKRNQFLLNESRESQRYKEIESMKEHQLMQLSRIESTMIEKHSRSRLGFEESNAKLRQFMLPLPLKKKSQRNDKKYINLPSLSTRANDSNEGDILIL